MDMDFISGELSIFTGGELSELRKHLRVESDSIVYERLRKLFTTNGWVEEEDLVNTLQRPLMRLCAHYLYTEKLRGYALDSVGKNINIHLNSAS